MVQDEPRTGIRVDGCARATTSLAGVAGAKTAFVDRCPSAGPTESRFAMTHWIGRFSRRGEPGDERRRHAQADISRKSRACGTERSLGHRIARCQRSERGAQFGRHGLAEAEGAGERLRLPHPHLRSGALSDGSKPESPSGRCRRGAVPIAAEADRHDPCRHRDAPQLRHGESGDGRRDQRNSVRMPEASPSSTRRSRTPS